MRRAELLRLVNTFWDCVAPPFCSMCGHLQQVFLGHVKLSPKDGDSTKSLGKHFPVLSSHAWTFIQLGLPVTYIESIFCIDTESHKFSLWQYSEMPFLSSCTSCFTERKQPCTNCAVDISVRLSTHYSD